MGKQAAKSSRRRAAATAGSWLALLAAATLGDGASTVHAEVKADGVRDGAYRLVVQSYDRAGAARPVGSIQRAVTADQLRNGVHVNLVELRGAQAAAKRDPVIVAWIEAGEPNLEFDGLTARPQPGSSYGVASRPAQQDVARISLNRRA
ncbi:MAG TPA: hypothetical protein VMI75_20725 [Polyangiaceae bacterium]|nr:hypothetical protein [Polyangiaceae bacterium]